MARLVAGSSLFVLMLSRLFNVALKWVEFAGNFTTTWIPPGFVIRPMSYSCYVMIILYLPVTVVVAVPFMIRVLSFVHSEYFFFKF